MSANYSMSCELCETLGGPLLWQDARARVVWVDDPLYPGFCRVIWSEHQREMTDLSPADRAHCMRIVFAVEAALRDHVKPDKINLASFGNMVSHVHWHVIPRFHDDPHFPQSIWGVQQRPVNDSSCSERSIPSMNTIAAALTQLLRVASHPK